MADLGKLNVGDRVKDTETEREYEVVGCHPNGAVKIAFGDLESGKDWGFLNYTPEELAEAGITKTDG
jgi:hypothetical protein